MERAVSAADANRKFSRLLRGVKQGQSYVVTSHGVPVARITPVKRDRLTSGARSSLITRLKSEKIVTIGRWKRDDLYDL